VTDPHGNSQDNATTKQHRPYRTFQIGYFIVQGIMMPVVFLMVMMMMMMMMMMFVMMMIWGLVVTIMLVTSFLP